MVEFVMILAGLLIIGGVYLLLSGTWESDKKEESINDIKEKTADEKDKLKKSLEKAQESMKEVGKTLGDLVDATQEAVEEEINECMDEVKEKVMDKKEDVKKLLDKAHESLDSLEQKIDNINTKDQEHKCCGKCENCTCGKKEEENKDQE